MTNDPHGYRRLYDELTDLETEIRTLGFDAAADRLRFAKRFYSGSSTEFMIETRSVLWAVLKEELTIPAPIRSRMAWIMDQITEGFRRAGGT